MTLEIVMPHYDEPWAVVKPFFDMLCCQRGIDFDQISVHIVHDGTEPFPDSIFRGMPFNVAQSRINHSGVSAARNYGLDHCKAKWVVFCDADDMFSGAFSLKLILDHLDNEIFDWIWSSFIAENVEDGVYQISVMNHFNLIWTHNKYFRVSFLREHGIRFEESLNYGEDSAFCAVVQLESDSKRIGVIEAPMPLYIWKWRAGSITTNPANKLRNMVGQFNRNLYALEQFRKRKHPDAILMVGRTITDAYIYLTRTDLPDGWQDMEKRVAEFCRQNRIVFSRITNGQLNLLLESSMREAEAGKFLNPNRPTLSDWLDQLENKYCEVNANV